MFSARLLAFILLGIGALMAAALPARAQNVGGVFGPEVTPASQAIEFRVAAAPRSDGRPARITSRFHYQNAVSQNLRLRAIVQGANTNTSNFDYDAIQLEAQYQFLENEKAGFDSAFRFDLLLAQDRADLVSFNWTNEFPIGERWAIRALGLAQLQFGPDRQDGLFLQTRASLAYKTNRKLTLEIQVFNTYGSTADFPGFDGQNHTLGPALIYKLSQGWSLEAGTQFGVTNAASDADFRVFLVKNF